MNRHCIDVLPGLLRVDTHHENALAASIFYIIASFNFDPMLRPAYAFTGVVYRGMRTSSDYIRTYKKNQLVVNRPFLSTSEYLEVAEALADVDNIKTFRRAQYTNEFSEASVVCTCKIRRPETRAIKITPMSKFSDNEVEILRMPISAFRIIDIGCDVNKSIFNIVLEDCDLPSKHDRAAPIIRCNFAEVPNVPIIMSFIHVKTRQYVLLKKRANTVIKSATKK